MSCILRITSENLREVLAGLSLKPYRFEHGTAHFQVSGCDFDNLPGQVKEATAFLNTSRVELSALLAAPAASGVLDFAVEAAGAEFRFAALPADLVREAASLGLAIELSQYPKAAENVA
jgi:hypothetical protein